MIRKDREETNSFGLDVIDRADYGILNLCRSDHPYGVPLSMVRKDNDIYFHCAREGKKLDLIRENNKVSVVFVTDAKVPDFYSEEELNDFVEQGDVSKILSSVYTTEYSSAMVFGEASEVTKEEEKILALRLICEKYTPDKMKYFDKAVEKSLKTLRVMKIEIEDITAKKKRVIL